MILVRSQGFAPSTSPFCRLRRLAPLQSLFDENWKALHLLMLKGTASLTHLSSCKWYAIF